MQRWTSDEIQRVQHMQHLGFTHQEIADALGRSRRSVSDKIRDLGLQNPRMTRSWSTSEITTLRHWLDEGISRTEIATRMHRSYASVANQCRRCGWAPPRYAAERSHA